MEGPEQMPLSEDGEFEALKGKSVDGMDSEELLRARYVLNNRRLDLKRLRDENPDNAEIARQSAETEGMFADVQYKIEGIEDEGETEE